jgi:hypothetical protein
MSTLIHHDQPTTRDDRRRPAQADRPAPRPPRRGTRWALAVIAGSLAITTVAVVATQTSDDPAKPTVAGLPDLRGLDLAIYGSPNAAAAGVH